MRSLRLLQTPVVGMAWCAVLLVAGCGHGIDSTEDLVAVLHQECKRTESRITPVPIRLNTLYEVASRPQRVEQVDDQRQRWQYDFADGQVEFTVMVEPGHRWSDENPRVFVNLRELQVF